MSNSARFFPLGAASHVEGYCYTINVPPDIGYGDSAYSSHASTARLFESGMEIGPGHVLHEEIARKGHGRFSHWGNTLYLSSSDGSPVSRNRHAYSLLIEPAVNGTAGLLRKASALVERIDNDYQRFELAERLFNALVPDVRVSEFGRTYFADREYAAFYERFGEGNYRAYDRRWTVGQLAGHAAMLPGQFAECGVYRGATAYLMGQALAQQAASERKLHLFDSFAGLSVPLSEDGEYWSPGDMAFGLADIQRNLADFSEHIIFYPGWIPSRFNEVEAQRFAFVHIDVDLFAPTRDSLAFFFDRMVPGGIILCDDYGFSSCPGARMAMDNFFSGRREKIIHLPTGQGLVIF